MSSHPNMISQISKLVHTALQMNHVNSGNQSIELEIRLGKFKQRTFYPGISKAVFYDMLKLYEWDIQEINETIFKQIPEKQRKGQGWVLKDAIDKMDNFNDHIRCCLNLETLYSFNDILQRNGATQENFQMNMIQMVRKKKRYSKTINHWRLDLTQVGVYSVKNNEWCCDKTVYEVEIELVDIHIESIESFGNIWNSIAKYHYGSIVHPSYYHLTKIHTFIGNRPKTLERTNLYLLKDYLVTDKIDGERMFLIFTHGKSFLLDNHLRATPFGINTQLNGTILDGEYINGKFLAFDCLFYCNKDIRENLLLERLEFVKKCNVELKTFVNISESKTLWTSASYPLDGLIFTPIYENYHGSIFKWKEHHTIDVFVNDNQELMVYCGKTKSNVLLKDYFKPQDIVQTLKTEQLVPNTIAEIGYNTEKHIWYLIKYRSDKKHPNAILTVKSVIQAIEERITIDDILYSLESKYQTPGKSYNKRQISPDIEYRKFHNQVKNYLISFPSNRKYLLDMGCGKGGDIMKWINAGYTDVLAIDNSHTHLYGPNGFKERYDKVRDKINITFVWGNVVKPLATCGMNQEENQKLQEWLNIKFDTITCQFAIHYLLNEKKEWDIFTKNIVSFLKKGGYFMGTYLNGHQLMSLPAKYDFTIDKIPFYHLSHEQLEYHPIKSALAFWKLKQQKLMVQTSEWNTPIEENVIFPEHLEILLTRCKLQKYEDFNFTTLLDEYNPPLTPDELCLSGLHHYFIYQKI